MTEGAMHQQQASSDLSIAASYSHPSKGHESIGNNLSRLWNLHELHRWNQRHVNCTSIAA